MNMNCTVSKVFRDDVRLEMGMCQSHECASRVPRDNKDEQQTCTKKFQKLITNHN